MRHAELNQVSRRYLASYVLFNQAVADRLGMHPTDVQCLNLLTQEAGPLTTGQIAQLTGLTSGAATRLVDRMERAGYVRRERDVDDRRRVLVHVVPAGLTEFTALWDDLGQGWDELFDDYSAAEVMLIVRHMNRTIALSEAQRDRLRTSE